MIIIARTVLLILSPIEHICSQLSAGQQAEQTLMTKFFCAANYNKLILPNETVESYV